MPRAPKNKTAKTHIRAREREIIACDMRVRGASLSEIAQRLEMTTSGTHAVIKRALVKLAKESLEHAKTLRALEEKRLDQLLGAVWGQAMSGDIQSVRTALLISSRRAALCGLDKQEESSANNQLVELMRAVSERADEIDKERVKATVTVDKSRRLGDGKTIDAEFEKE
jgi:hypothetical protein